MRVEFTTHSGESIVGSIIATKLYHGREYVRIRLDGGIETDWLSAADCLPVL